METHGNLLTLPTKPLESAGNFEPMKTDIHPQSHPTIFRDSTAKKDFIVHSTIVTDQKEKINGVEYSVVLVDVSSASHPFFTGKQHLVDTSGRVEKFRAKMEKAGKTTEVPKAKEAPTPKKEEPKEEPKAEETPTKEAANDNEAPAEEAVTEEATQTPDPAPAEEKKAA